MKENVMKNNIIYYIMTYIMFLYPPFIYFLVMINFENMNDRIAWITGVFADIVFVLITTGVLLVLSYKKILPKPEKDERNHFIFGYIGNAAVFLYTYQYMMNIEKLVSVFSLVLILVLAYKFLVSKQISFKEIFISSIIFSAIDYIIIIFSGNTLLSGAASFTAAEMIIYQILFNLAIIYTIVLYVFKLYKNHQWSILRFVLIGFIVICLAMLYIDDTQDEFILTFVILAVFTWLIDIIMRLIRKEFKVYDLAFYARIIMLTIVFVMIKEMDLYRFNNFNLGQMYLLIAIFYVTAFSDIIMNISPHKQKELELNLSVIDYVKWLYRPVVSRYKDVLVVSQNTDIEHDLTRLGRKVIKRQGLEDLQNIDINAISFVILYSDKPDEIETIVKLFPKLKVCVISPVLLTNPLLKTGFTDFKYFVYSV